LAYLAARSRPRLADPDGLRRDPDAPAVERVHGDLEPSPSLPRRFASGTSTLSKWICVVELARIPSFSSFLPTETPGNAFSTRNAEIPFGPEPRSRVAKTMNRPACRRW